MPTIEGLRGQLAHSSRIAAALLEVLAESGDVGARARALRAVGVDGPMLRSGTIWLGKDRLAKMLRAADVDPRLARRVGQALVRPDGVGLALCYSGLATPEKAYRRSHQLLARESEDSHYEPREIDDQRGRILFHPAPEDDPSRPDADTGAALCALRGGMLEAVPLLFGLVPARVREKSCAYRGASVCEFDVSWTRTTRVGLMAGMLAGSLIAASMILLGPSWGLPLGPLAVAGMGLVVVCAAAGRSVDLARQLEAVAGARRGQLALLDQLDTSLAERMDELAKLDPHAEAVGEDASRDSIHGLVPVSRDPDSLAGVATGELERQLSAGETAREVCAPDTLLRRALEGLRAELPPELCVETDLAADVPAIECDAFQIEHVVEQLLRNAVEASAGSGTVRLSLTTWPGGIEIAVEDDGDGIEQDAVEEVFDPFVGAGPGGEPGGLGLPVCYRIVEEHGGELHVRASQDTGTRVSIVLPTRA